MSVVVLRTTVWLTALSKCRIGGDNLFSRQKFSFPRKLAEESDSLDASLLSLLPSLCLYRVRASLVERVVDRSNKRCSSSTHSSRKLDLIGGFSISRWAHWFQSLAMPGLDFQGERGWFSPRLPVHLYCCTMSWMRVTPCVRKEDEFLFLDMGRVFTCHESFSFFVLSLQTTEGWTESSLGRAEWSCEWVARRMWLE